MDEINNKLEQVDETNKKNGKPQNAAAHNTKKSRHKKKPRTSGAAGGSRESSNSAPKVNDPSWYTPSEAIAKAVASIPFSRYPGGDFLYGGGNIRGADVLTTTFTNKTLPGVMRINYAHTVGGDNSAVSAVNMAARAIYTFVRHQNSGHSNYESADMMIYLLSVYECFALYCEGVRAYKTALTYSQENRLIPDALLTAMGFTPAAVRGGLADFRAGLNIVAAKLSSLCVPGDLPIIQRWAFLASGVWMDSASETGQYYVPVLKHYGRFTPTSTGGGSIIFREKSSNTSTPTGFLNMLNECLDTLLQDEDSNIMSGDILKAYGREKMLRAVEVPDTAVLVPIYNEDFLNALENATFVALSADNFNIAQVGGVIQQALIIDDDDFKNTILAGNIVFNSHKEAPDYRDVLEWSRFTAVIDPADDPSMKREIRCGSECVIGLDVILRVNNSYVVAQSFDTNVLTSTTIGNVGGYTTARDAWNAASMLSMFDWCPMFYSVVCELKEGKYTITYNNLCADLDKPTLITPQVMERIHDVALLGEFRNPLLP